MRRSKARGSCGHLFGNRFLLAGNRVIQVIRKAAKQIQTQIRLRAEHCPVRRGVADLMVHAAGSCGVMS